MTALTHFPHPTKKVTYPTPPTRKVYDDCCNEFWWEAPYVAKGLARGEILYAKHFLDIGLRNQLMLMLTWAFGIRTNFKCNPGKIGKHFQEILAPNNWSRLLETYSSANPYDTWKGLLEMCDLFRDYAYEVADEFGFKYPHQEDTAVTRHLMNMNDKQQL